MSKRRASEDTFPPSKRADSGQQERVLRAYQLVDGQRALNTEFVRWILEQDLDLNWTNGLNHYLRHAKQLHDDYFDVYQRGPVSHTAERPSQARAPQSSGQVTFGNPLYVHAADATPAGEAAAAGASGTPETGVLSNFAFNAGSTPAPPGGLSFKPTPGSEITPAQNSPPTPVLFGAKSPAPTPAMTLNFGDTSSVSPSPGPGNGTGASEPAAAAAAGGSPFGTSSSPVMGFLRGNANTADKAPTGTTFGALDKPSSSSGFSFGNPPAAAAAGSKETSTKAITFGGITTGGSSSKAAAAVSNEEANGKAPPATSPPQFSFGVPGAAATASGNGAQGASGGLFSFANGANAGTGGGSAAGGITFGIPAAAAAMGASSSSTAAAAEGGTGGAPLGGFGFPQATAAGGVKFNLGEGAPAGDDQAAAAAAEDEEEQAAADGGLAEQSELQLDPTFEYLWDGKAKLFCTSKGEDERVRYQNRGVGRLTIRKHTGNLRYYIVFNTENGKQLSCTPILGNCGTKLVTQQTEKGTSNAVAVSLLIAQLEAPPAGEGQEQPPPSAKRSKWTACMLRFGNLERAESFIKGIEDVKAELQD